MLLKLNCRAHDGALQSWLYDNAKNIITDPSGKAVDLKGDSRFERFLKKGACESKGQLAMNKSTTLWDLRIQLGLKCNMNCKYCAQSDRAKELSVFGPKDVEPLLEKLKAAGIQVKGVVEFWGGEPLVYWKTLLKLIPALREMYPETHFAMVTNGTLIDEEKIAFFEKYKVSLTFSHDGPGYRLRGDDPLDDPAKVDLWRFAFSKLPCSINCVLSPANTDIDAIAEFFREKLGDIHLNFEGIMTHVGVQNDELMFTDAQLLALQKSIFTALTRDGWDKFPALTGIAETLISKIVNRVELDSRSPKCAMHRTDNAAINMNGDVLSCHDHCTPDCFVGHISDMGRVDVSKHFKPWSERPKCAKCLVLSQCRGSCPQMEGLARTLTCKNEFAYHFAVFQAVWWLLFGLTIESYEVCDAV